MSYFARFMRLRNSDFRFDTRIYLRESPRDEQDGECVAAIVAKNPGSAQATVRGQWGPLELANDKMLPSVRKRFIDGYRLSGKAIPRSAFVRVWNLFYLCDNNLQSAILAVRRFDAPPICKGEATVPAIVWFAWGGSDARLNPFKTRFRGLTVPHAFFYDQELGRVVSAIPSTTDFAKHPQGLRSEPIVEHLGTIL
jgi:hypothetical protein